MTRCRVLLSAAVQLVHHVEMQQVSMSSILQFEVVGSISLWRFTFLSAESRSTAVVLMGPLTSPALLRSDSKLLGLAGDLREPDCSLSCHHCSVSADLSEISPITVVLSVYFITVRVL